MTLKATQIMKHVEYMSEKMPCAMYWLDTDYIVVGANYKLISGIGASSRDDIIGKTVYHFYPKHIADSLQQDFKMAIELGHDLEHEHVIEDITTGATRYFAATVSPLRDDSGKIIGVIGTSIEITDSKEKEYLELENKAKQARIEEQEKFRKIADQVAHDIRSPISTMQMVLPYCDVLPENIRDTLNKSAIRIADIANNLLNQFKVKDDDKPFDDIQRAPALISAELLEVLTEKKYEYGQLPVNFIANINQTAYFGFINVDIRAFKRSISNLINNAVDSFDENVGDVTVILVADDSFVKVIIQDNGKGMPSDVVEKIMNNIEVTSGKKDGFGIGFTQVRDMLVNNDGKLVIESIVNMGSKVAISFPRVAAPDWIAEKIDLHLDDLVIVLDDDESIHGAWQARFDKAAPYIKRRHYKKGYDAVNFINSLTEDEKSKVFLLTDYELLRQNLHGLDVVEKTKVNRSILVTSHHNNQDVRKAAKLTKTKILPKPLASEIPINILDNIVENKEVSTNIGLRKVDLVIVDDDKDFIDSFVRFVTRNEKLIDKYYTASEFQVNVAQYPKNTHFLIDHSFKGEQITGVELSIRLNEQGFTNLHLFSGRDLRGDSSIPGYLNLILKTDLEAVKRLLNL